MTKSESLCLAPWVHTYLSPQTERRMCCASREPAQNFRQYIDTESGTGTYIPITLEQHWNSEHMRSVRRINTPQFYNKQMPPVTLQCNQLVGIIDSATCVILSAGHVETC